jgi:hypothetical protein
MIRRRKLRESIGDAHAGGFFQQRSRPINISKGFVVAPRYAI